MPEKHYGIGLCAGEIIAVYYPQLKIACVREQFSVQCVTDDPFFSRIRITVESFSRPGKCLMKCLGEKNVDSWIILISSLCRLIDPSLDL